ncbi:MAG: SH3 domain-containing protein [Clostridia bacterium]
MKESVNVRSDATTDSDRIALAYQGDAITEIESYDNGWSKVEYKGQTGYVKTEFLE